MGDRNRQGAAPTGPEPSQVETICHDEQMTIWTGEIASSLSMGGYFRDDLSYDDKLDLHAVIARDLRDIITTALAEIIREVTSFVGCVEALQRHTNPFDVNEGHSQQWFAVHDAIQTRIKPRIATPHPGDPR